MCGIAERYRLLVLSTSDMSLIFYEVDPKKFGAMYRASTKSRPMTLVGGGAPVFPTSHTANSHPGLLGVNGKVPFEEAFKLLRTFKAKTGMIHLMPSQVRSVRSMQCE